MPWRQRTSEMAPSLATAGVDPRQEDKYLLQVTSGPSYEEAEKHVVTVNGSESCRVENDLMTTFLHVRIRDYHGLPSTSSTSSPYFSHPLHTSDRYSISFTFVPKHSVPGTDLIMGFDFDHPVRDRLPPGFKTAMKIVTTVLDPGIYSDPYSDEPYLYGAALSSFFALRVGGKVRDSGDGKEREGRSEGGGELDGVLRRAQEDKDGVVEEGGDGDGVEIRERVGMPAKAEKRRKFFLDEGKLEKFTFEEGRIYQADFFNSYLDFSSFALKVPGISISVAKYIDEKTHSLRYVLKNRRTGDVFFVIIFKLLFGQEMQETLESQKRDVKEKHVLESSESHDNAQSTQQLAQHATQHATQHPASPQTSKHDSTKSDDLHGPERIGKDEGAGPHGETIESSQTRPSNSSKTDAKTSAANAARVLADSITSAFSALGFGGASQEETSRPPKQPRKSSKGDDETSNRDIDNLSDGAVEEFLKAKHGTG
ncbi:MAG: hypothetical protein Q9165_007720 [Trypethelium subeluteriae]